MASEMALREGRGRRCEGGVAGLRLRGFALMRPKADARSALSIAPSGPVSKSRVFASCALSYAVPLAGHADRPGRLHEIRVPGLA